MNIYKQLAFLLLRALGGVLLPALIASTSTAQQVISYQGTVTNSGAPLTGPHTIVLSIYSTATGGTALHTETQSVTFTNGLFNVLLGSDHANPLPMFDAGDVSGTVRPAADYFLGISIDAGAELTPRAKLGAAATAWSSRVADSARTAGMALTLDPGAGGVVRSLNSLSGVVTLAGAGGTTITNTGQTITISSSGSGGTGILGVQNIDGTINVIGPTGPTATISLADGAVSSAKIQSGAVTTAKIAAGAVTNAVVGSGSATNGQVLTANGTGGATWVTPGALSLPYSNSLSSNSTLFALTNSGSGMAISGAASAAATAGVNGSTSSATGVGVMGITSDGSGVGIMTNTGVFGASSTARGVAGLTNSGYGVEGAVASTGVGIYGTAGAGAVTARAGLFEITNSASTANAVEVNTPGTGSAIKAVASSTSSTSPAILGQTASTGAASGIQGELTSSTPSLVAAGVYGVNDGSNGSGIGVYGHCLANGIGVYGRTETGGIAIEGVTNGNGDAIYGEGDGTGNGVHGLGWQGGTGVLAEANSTGTACNAFIANMMGSTTSTVGANNCAIFESAGTHVARIDRTGKGFFNGGTQTGGADVAEEFDVPGDRSSYSPGDVLVISQTGTREVEKSSKAYSRLVAGVYATKPGVILTNVMMDGDHSAKVPLGVIGVIPTKVTLENGPISAGDLLVTSSTPGHAMKADLSKLQIGQALGKALGNFSGPGTGVIEVLVGKY
ncbi:MAG: hypothetical protein Q8922_05560 [Bacteroidota bacterium]|nr:hypothetical protein [Bacteroidota bacterium]MDP4233130.1 hypothetical protein [Bacteroidota bacterium]MDP4241725.1 hypothetical protein [Bacteroidota bacterium]MDP4287383.1 hypothetical protein [Bacteroidota bacterium]